MHREVVKKLPYCKKLTARDNYYQGGLLLLRGITYGSAHRSNEELMKENKTNLASLGILQRVVLGG